MNDATEDRVKLYDVTHYNFLYDQLVPNDGPAEYLEGELLRAISRIHYDYLNNGFGNNWSPPRMNAT
jgi:hypothetical protein